MGRTSFKSLAGSIGRVVLLLGCVAVVTIAAQTPVVGQEKPAEELTFHDDIFPILKESCLRCHNARKKDGKLDLSDLKSLLKGGVSGPPLVPGDAKKSLMVDMIFFGEMPPKKQQPRVSKDDLKLIEAWINAGAPEGEKPTTPPEPTDSKR